MYSPTKQHVNKFILNQEQIFTILLNNYLSNTTDTSSEYLIEFLMTKIPEKNNNFHHNLLQMLTELLGNYSTFNQYFFFCIIQKIYKNFNLTDILNFINYV